MIKASAVTALTRRRYRACEGGRKASCLLLLLLVVVVVAPALCSSSPESLRRGPSKGGFESDGGTGSIVGRSFSPKLRALDHRAGSGKIERFGAQNSKREGPGRAVHKRRRARDLLLNEDDGYLLLTNTFAFKACLASFLVVIVLGKVYIFAAIVRHREKSSLQLAQPAALSMFMVAAIAATASCYLLIPGGDIECALRDPLLLTSLNLMGSVLAGRAWRINTLLNPVMTIGASKLTDSRLRRRGSVFTQNTKSATMYFLGKLSHWSCLMNCVKKTSAHPSYIRRKVPIRQFLLVVFIMMLPQLMLQTMNLSLHAMRQTQTIHYSEFGVARFQCQRDQGLWPTALGALFVIVQFVITLFLNTRTDELPDIFKELDANLRAYRIFFVVLIVAGPSCVMADNPDARVYLQSSVILGFVLPICAYSVVSKLQPIWKGEKIAVDLSSTASSSLASTAESSHDQEDALRQFADLALRMGKMYQNMGMTDKCVELYDEALSLWKRGDTNRDSAETIGEFTHDEVRSFGASELELIIKLHIAKGELYGTLNSEEHDSQQKAAKAWIDAVYIFEKAPASKNMKDRTIIFPCYSGMFVFLKGGKIVQDDQSSFERDLVKRFVRETRLQAFHYARALAMEAEVMARLGFYDEAFGAFGMMKDIYVPEEHMEHITKEYGTDRCAHAFAQSALWYMQQGHTEASLTMCEHVIDNLLPRMDPKNCLGVFELLLPVIRILKWQGEGKRMRDIFDCHVVQTFKTHYGEEGKTPCKPVLKPMLLLLSICDNTNKYGDMQNDIEWVLDKCYIPDFVDSLYTNVCWSMKSLVAEICLHLARRLDDCKAKRHLIDKGLKLSQRADQKMKDKGGNVKLPIPYEIHAPIMAELQVLAEEQGLDGDTMQPLCPRFEKQMEMRFSEDGTRASWSSRLLKAGASTHTFQAGASTRTLQTGANTRGSSEVVCRGSISSAGGAFGASTSGLSDTNCPDWHDNEEADG